MADKGILVNSQDGGTSVACVDIRKTDADSNPRILQLNANTVSPGNIFGVETGTPIRVLNFSDTMGDPVVIDYTSLNSAGIVSSTLDVSDASAFVVHVVWDLNASGYSREFRGMLTPIIFNDDKTEVAFPLYPVLLKHIHTFEDGVFDASLMPEEYGSFNPNIMHIGTEQILCVPMVFPTLGAKHVGFHVRASSSMTHICNIFAYPLTGEKADTALAYSAHITREITSSYIPGEVTTAGGDG